MSAYLSKKVGVPIYVGTAGIWPSEISIWNFNIKNPQGFSLAAAFEARALKARYHLKNLFATPSEIEEIVINHAYLYVEIPKIDGPSNWEVIGARMRERVRAKGVTIQRLIIRDLTAQVAGKGAIVLGVAGKHHFEELVFDQTSSSTGFPTKELSRKIFESIGFGSYLEKFLNPTERIEESINPFQFF